MADRHGRFYALLAMLLAAFATMPLLQPYFVASSDGLYHLFRLMEYDTVLRDGVLYPRWAPDFFFGLGMPLFNYYAPLTYYLAEVFHLLGAGYIDSLRLLAAAAMALAGLGAYLYARTLLSPPSALLVAAAYMYVPYHLVNLYYRGDLAEYVAYTWFPFILWAMSRLLQTRRFVYLFAGGVFYAALILTHNLSAFIFSGFLVIYAAALLLRRHWTAPRRSRDMLADALRLAGLALAACALTAFFWLPALTESSLVAFDRLLAHYNFRDSFPTFEQLFSRDLIHRYGVIFRSAEVYGYKLGLLQVIFLILGPILLLWPRRRWSTALRVEAITSLLVAAVSLFLILPASTPVWESVPLLYLTQFAWRFLAFLALPGALLAGLAVEVFPPRLRPAPLVVLVPLVIASSIAGMAPMMSDVKEADVSPRGSMAFELTYGNIGTSAAAEYLPTWVKERAGTSAIALATVLGENGAPVAGRTSPGMEAVVVERRADRVGYQLRAEKGGEFVANVLYFPGWVAFLDGRQVDTAIDDPTGLIKIAVPAGTHALSLHFGETPLRQRADALSALALLILLAFLARDLRGHRRAPMRLPALGLSKANLVPIAVLAALVPLWLLVRAGYDARYVLPGPYRFPLIVNLGGEVLIEGYDLSGVALPSPGEGGARPRLLPGAPFQVTIFWRPLGADSGRRYQPFLRMTNSFRQTWAYAESATAYTPADARPGEPIATTFDVTIPPGTPPGAYEFEIGFAAGAERQPLPVRRVTLASPLPGESGARFGPVIVGKGTAAMAGVDRTTGSGAPGAASAALPEAVNFGDQLRLLDVSFADGTAPGPARPGGPPVGGAERDARQIRAGESIHLDFLWQALPRLGGDLRISARLAGAGTLWSNKDNAPADGAYPTSLWTSGEVVRDQMNLAVPPETPPGRYELQLEVVSRAGPLSILDLLHNPIGPTLRLGKVAVLPAATPADPLRVKVQQRANIPLPNGLALRGYSLGRSELQPGEQLKVDLLWAARQVAGRDLAMRLELRDQTGKPWADASGRPVGDAYPTTLWREGEVLRGQYSLTLQAQAPEGEADVSFELLDATSGESLAQLTLDRVRVLPRSRSFAAAPAHPLAKAFGGEIRLLGFDLAGETGKPAREVPEVPPGAALSVTLHWQAIAETGTSYTVFAQVLNAAGRLVAQHDSPPQSGAAPTTGWVPGEVVADEHAIPIPADLPEGDYTVIAGLYDALTGKRLPVEGGGDFVVLTPVHIASVAR